MFIAHFNCKAMLNVLILLVLLVYCFGSLSDPTRAEISAGFVVKQLHSWGQQVREQNCLKILCIGGSNTANLYNGRGYVNLLDQYIKSNLSKNEFFNSHSYAINRGVSGRGLEYFTGKKFDFELHSDYTSWPNVVIVDTSVNMPNLIHIENSNDVRGVESHDVMVLLERLIRSFAYKYKLRNLPCPQFLFYNMPHLKNIFKLKPPLKTVEERQRYVDKFLSISENFDYDAQIRQFCSFYHIPVLSWGQATLPAALRHYINSSFESTPWEYSEDGVHMSPSVGTQFGINNLLGPFFKEAINPRKEDKLIDLSQWPRMFPVGPINMEVAEYSSYIGEVNSANLSDIIYDVRHSQWKTVPFMHTSYCYGSTQGESIGELRFNVPTECSVSNTCHVKISFIHSWNSSYIGNAECTLIKHEANSRATTHLSKVFVNGQDEVGDATYSVGSQFNVNITGGLHAIKCSNIIDNRLSCITALEINSVVMV